MKNVHIQPLVYKIVLILISASVLLILPLTASANSAPTCIFNAIVQPSNNGGTTLSWRAYNATTVRITNLGIVSANDSFVVYPQTTKVYTLTATGNGVRSCSVTVLPVSTYTSGTTINTLPSNTSCNMWIRPDFIVSGGTGILSWNAVGASSATITNGIGSVPNIGSKIIPNRGVPETYTMSAKWGSGATRTCSATLYPATSLNVISPVPVVYVPGSIVTPYQLQYVSVNRIPYTGTNDALYLVLLLLISSGSFTIMYIQRKRFLALFF